MYVLCKGMKWSHLPEPGGLYDQHPKLIDDFQMLMGIDARAQKKNSEATMGGMNKNKPSPYGRRRRK